MVVRFGASQEMKLDEPGNLLEMGLAAGPDLLEAGLNSHFDLSSSQEFDPDHGTVLPLSMRMEALTMQSKDAAEAQAAFREKREPNFAAD